MGPDGVVVSLKRSGVTAVLVVRGCLDAGTAHVVQGHVESVLEESGQAVVDLTGVTFFSADGAAALAAASRRGRLHVVVTPLIRHVLEKTGRAGALHLHDFPVDAEQAAQTSARPLLLVG